MVVGKTILLCTTYNEENALLSPLAPHSHSHTARALMCMGSGGSTEMRRKYRPSNLLFAFRVCHNDPMPLQETQQPIQRDGGREKREASGSRTGGDEGRGCTG